MSRLRVRLRFNPGRDGSPMDKLGEFATQAERFLRSFADDLGVQARKGQWLARNFTNESVAFDAEFVEQVAERVTDRAFTALDLLTGNQPMEATNRGHVSLGTIAEFARIGKIMDPDEKFYVGLYRDGPDQPERWREVSYRQTSEIRLLLDSPIPTYGSVQGVVYSWSAGAQPAFFSVRDLSSGVLVRCEYTQEAYSQIHAATRSPNTVVHVYGDVRWDRITNSILDVLVQEIEIAQPLSESEFESIFGSMPGFTGELTTDEYMEELRDNGA